MNEKKYVELIVSTTGSSWKYDADDDILYEVSYSNPTELRLDGPLTMEADPYFRFTKEENVVIFSPQDDDLAAMHPYFFIRCLRRRFKNLGIKVKTKKSEFNREFKMTFCSDADYAYFILHYSQHIK